MMLSITEKSSPFEGVWDYKLFVLETGVGGGGCWGLLFYV